MSAKVKITNTGAATLQVGYGSDFDTLTPGQEKELGLSISSPAVEAKIPGTAAKTVSITEHEAAVKAAGDKTGYVPLADHEAAIEAATVRSKQAGAKEPQGETGLRPGTYGIGKEA